MNKERKTLTHKFEDARCRLPSCRAEGCCWVRRVVAITKKCFEVGGYVQCWEDAAGGYQKKRFLGLVIWLPQPADQVTGRPGAPGTRPACQNMLLAVLAPPNQWAFAALGCYARIRKSAIVTLKVGLNLAHIGPHPHPHRKLTWVF